MNRFLASLATAAALLVFCLSASAQGGYQIRGTIVDQTGEPVIGATVMEQGTTNGASTDFEGNFALTVSSGDATVEVSCIGYTTLAYTASAVPQRILLEEDNMFLDDAIVIGYGTVKRTDLTGSVSTVKADEINSGVITSPADLLRGKSAGVVVTSGTGMPGSSATIRVRGGSSLSATNDPLVIIDGLPVGNESISGASDPLSSINPNDIESFTVLKDASATAIYGSRASNGVIVITTKKGAKGGSGKPTFNLDVTASLSQIQKYADVMTADELRNAIATLYGTDSNAYAALGTDDTDWQKEIYRLAQTYEANFSMNGRVGLGKAGNAPYRFSAGYLSQEGILKTSKMDRLTVSGSFNPSLLDDHLTINLNGKYMYSYNSFANSDAIGAAFHYDPTQPVYYGSTAGAYMQDLNGYTTWYDASGNINTMATENPVALLNEKKDVSDVHRFIGNIQFNYKVHGLEDLSVNLNLGLDWASSDGDVESPIGSEQSYHTTSQSGSGYHTDYDYHRRDQTLEAYINYNHDFKGGHHFDIMGGYSYQHFYNDSWSAQYKLSDGEYISDTPSKTEYFLISFFGRANYSFKNRYMLTATIRRDGTSRFSNHHWGLFPSVALGWNIINENFLKNNGVLSDLKLRLSWGQTGQQDLNEGNYPTLATYYSNLQGSYYYFGSTLIYPVTALGYNAELKWETTTTWNAGLDWGFFDGRLTSSFDVYYRETTDLINYIPVAALSNLTNYITTNIGSLENTGVEFEVSAIPIQTKDWSWTITANAAWNKNKITKLTAAGSEESGIETGSISGGTGNTVQMHQVGYPTSAYYVYQQVYDEDGNPIEGEYVDRNGDGVVDADDKYFYHKPAPDVTVGLNTTVTWKNWTFALSGHGSFGNWNYNNVASDNELLTDLWTNTFVSNRLSSALETNFSGAAQYTSDYYVRNASFFKIDNITLGYTFPSILKTKDRNLGLNIYCTVQNVATITGYDGIDPEVSGGIDGNIYPRPRSYILGLKFSF